MSIELTASFMYQRRATPGFLSLLLFLGLLAGCGGSASTSTSPGAGTTPTAPALTLSQSVLSFGSVATGSTSAAQTMTATNTGTAALTLSSISVTGTNAASFAETNTCGATLAAGAGCSVSVSFTPASAGALSASLTLTDNATGSPQSVTLSGTGTAAPAPAASLSASSLTFSAIAPGVVSAAQTLTLTNSGAAPLAISSIALGGTNPTLFHQTNTCGSTLAAVSACTISVSFAPAVSGTFNATLTVTDNAAGSPQVIALSGTASTATAPAVTLSASSLTFASTAQGSASAAQTVMLTNSGTAPLTITSIALGGANPASFPETNSCGTTLAAAASCTVSVSFVPSTTGALSASLLLTDSAAGSPQTIALSGTASAAAASAVTLSTSTLTFPSTTQGSASVAQTVMLTNSGTAPLTITSIALGGSNASSFTDASTCGGTLAAASACTISVTFTPSASGGLSASLLIADSASGSPQSVALTGTGTAVPAPALTLSVPSLSFASTSQGSTSAAQTVIVTNSGNAPLTLSSIDLSGANASSFSESGTCSGTLAAASACMISVTFTPGTIGALSASLLIVDNATGSPHSVALTGTGAAAPTPVVTLSASSLTFASTTQGTASAAQPITLSNSGTASLTISGITLAGANAASFTETTTCGSALAANASCIISVGFSPAAVGALSANLILSDNGSGSSQTIALSGTATASVPAATLSTTSLTFPSTAQGSTSTAQTVTLTNTGNASLTISGIMLSGANAASFAETSTCGGTLAVSSACTVSVSFAPAANGALSAGITVTDNAAGSPQSIALNGTGTAAPAPAVTLSATSLTFASTVQGAASATQTVTLTNTGNASLAISSITLAGVNASSFGQTNTCASALAASTACTFSISFVPMTTGALTAGIVIADNATGASQSIALSGTGTAGAPAAIFNANSLTFSSTQQGTTSAAQAITLTNSGTSALTITSLVLGGSNPSSFSQSNNCGSSLASTQSCTISVEFIPAASGALSATLTVSDSATGSPQAITLTGTGTAAGTPALTFSPATLGFGAVNQGVSGAPVSTIVTNAGTAPTTFSSIAVSGSSYTMTTTCGASLAVNASCLINVVFTPVTTGTLTGKVTLTDNLSSLQQTIALSGAGTAVQATFIDPILAKGADPAVILVNGLYYSVQSGCTDPDNLTPIICLRVASTLYGLNAAQPVEIWEAPASGPNSANVWAPQIEYLNNTWYIYYTATDTGLTDHTLFAIVPSDPTDPLGQWVAAPTGVANGALVTNWQSTWGIDPDVFLAHDGNYYLVYSCRQNNNPSGAGTNQSICLSAMTDPLHLTGQTVELAQPTQLWETRTIPTEEGPFGFTNNGIDYIAYSASFSGTPDDYATGLFINSNPPQPAGSTNALTNPASWVKQGPYFDGHHASYGTASVVLVNSPDNTELWNVYHGTDCLTGCSEPNGNSWPDRSVRAQKAGWNPSGSLVLGYPVDILNTDGTGQSVNVASPSINGGGTMSLPAWGNAFGDAARGDTTHGLVVGSWNAATPSTISSTSLDANQLDQNFLDANPNFENYIIYTNVQATATGSGDANPGYGLYAAYVGYANYFQLMINTTTCASPGCLTTSASVNGAAQPAGTCTLPTGFNAAAVNKLVVQVVNGLFTIYLNGSVLTGTCEGQQYLFNGGQEANHGSNGQVGVVVENTQATFTNFTVSPGVPLDSTAYPQTYSFLNQASLMNLDNNCDGGCGGSVTNSVAVIQNPATPNYPLATELNQVFTLKSLNNGYFEIVSSLSGLCVADPNGNTTPSRNAPIGTSTILWQQPCLGNTAQSWQFLPVPTASSFIIQNLASSLVIDSYNTSAGTQVYANTMNGGASQIWQLQIK